MRPGRFACRGSPIPPWSRSGAAVPMGRPGTVTTPSPLRAARGVSGLGHVESTALYLSSLCACALQGCYAMAPEVLTASRGANSTSRDPYPLRHYIGTSNCGKFTAPPSPWGCVRRLSTPQRTTGPMGPCGCRTGEYTPERDWPPRLAAGVRRWRFQVFPWAPRLRIDSRVV